MNDISKHKDDGYQISTDNEMLDVDLIINFLCSSYWGKDYKPENILKSIENSFCFGLYIAKRQIGFARVITDYMHFAWLADVFIVPEMRGKKCGKIFMEAILGHPDLIDVKRWRLATLDAHNFYSKFGFTPPVYPERFMERVK
ncbi:MAG TPA: GNAT family N-acetyltransferase [Parasegetibacter sp.]